MGCSKDIEADVFPPEGEREEEVRPVTLADLRHFRMMQMWLAANPDWEG
jgi:hypothetical protein